MMKAVRSTALWLRSRPRLGAAALRAVPDLPITISLRRLGKFRIRLRRNRAFWLRAPEAHEAMPLRALRLLVRDGDVVANVGANLGLYDRFLCGWTKARKIYAFEPWAPNVELLRANLRLGGCGDRVEVLECALADVAGELPFQVDDVQSASGSLDRVARGGASEGRANLGLPPKVETVRTATLDELVEQGRLEAVDVIKLDVEGAEALVLEGSKRLLERRKPRLLVELHGAEVAREVLRFLFARGYSVAGWSGSEFERSNYRRIDPRDVEAISGRYDVNFVVACADGELPSGAEMSRGPFDGPADFANAGAGS